jgi:hypothetical protein
VTWGTPGLNYDLMLQASLRAGAKQNQIVYRSNLFDWKNQTLTPLRAAEAPIRQELAVAGCRTGRGAMIRKDP